MHSLSENDLSLMEQVTFAEIAVFLPIDYTLYYSIPETLQQRIKIGQRVLVSVGNRTLIGGLILSLSIDIPDSLNIKKIRPIVALLDEVPVIQESMVPFLKWLSYYYVYPIGETICSILPPGIKVTTSLRLKITPEGLKYLEGSSPSAEEKKILGILRVHENISISSLVRQIGNPDCFKCIKKLRTRGYIATINILKTRRKTVKSFKVVHALSTELPSTIKIKDRLELLWNKLQDNHGFMSLSTLNREIPNVYYWVRKLEKAGLVEITEKKASDELLKEEESGLPSVAFKLTPDQEKIIHIIENNLNDLRFKVYLLHGVTGSGKTEIYIRLFEKVLERNHQCLIIVPEIALSTHLERIFYRKFGSNVAVLHSGLSDNERFAQWQAILSGKSRIVLGARSGVFAPLPKLGLIVVDEEQDSSFKQQSGLCYHGRDVAIMRAKLENIPIILGSATPSLESYHHAITGKYQLLELQERINKRALPRIEIVDMRRQGKRETIFSRPLLKEIDNALERREQVLLFLNRRGFTTFMMCIVCGEVLRCKHCSISLTFHKDSQRLRCHYCGFSMKVPSKCPKCGGTIIKSYGFGTEKVEEEVRKLFNGNQTSRLDSDTARNRRVYKKIFTGVRNRQIDILIGTQIVAKGHDFPGITLVGVLSADISLQIPDFRASETTFQTIAQVAGRAGRGNLPGKVFVQTYNPYQYVFRFLQTHDYAGFAREEIKLRKQLDYPPFSRLSRILVSGHSKEKVKEISQKIAQRSIILKETTPCFSKINILGPVEAPLAFLRNQHRWHLFIKAPSSTLIHSFVYRLLDFFKAKSGQGKVKINIDIDPFSVL